ncbi:hypothetical protein B0H14DRAFT_3491373 [Mycena olivaceomarginata]|nr:hypothetical protein B0H14DRAFT_3491373 [Mycena olivaceomarginata]
MSQQLVSTNLRAEDLIMDIRGGGNNPCYYCLPPFRGSTDGGHIVGIFDNWHETKASECIEGWQALCWWGIHPHPMDPVHAVNTSPRKQAKASAAPAQGASAAPEQKVYDLKVLCTPPRSPAVPPRPQKAGRHEAGDQDFVNFAIRGVSFPAARRAEEPEII